MIVRQLLDCSLQAQFYRLRPCRRPASLKAPTVGALLQYIHVLNATIIKTLLNPYKAVALELEIKKQ